MASCPMDVNIAGTEDTPGGMPQKAEFTEFDDFDFPEEEEEEEDVLADDTMNLDEDFGAGFSVLDGEEEE